MAELEYGNRDNLFNVIKKLGPDGRMLDMVNALTENNPYLRFLPSLPTNYGNSFKGLRKVSLPSPSIKVVGGGVTPSRGDSAPFVEGICIIASEYQVPEDVLAHSADPVAHRRDEERDHEEAISQSFANLLIQGDATQAPETINGLQNRAPWNDVSETEYCIDLGGTSNLRSCWLMCPGRSRFHLLHNGINPMTSVKRTVKPSQRVAVTTTDSNGSGYRWDSFTEFEFEQGFAVPDQRAVKRLANIDYSDKAGTVDLVDQVIFARLIHGIPGQWYLVCDPYIYINLVQAAGKLQNVRYSADNPYRMELPMIGDVIVSRCDALNTSESQVT